MRLIDADALLEQTQFRLPVDNLIAECYADAVRIHRENIEEAPTIDAVPVVRCKDCKHWGKYGVSVAGETDNVKACEWAIWMVGENGYCVYGERKDCESDG